MMHTQNQKINANNSKKVSAAEVAAAAKTLAERLPESEREKLFYMMKGIAFATDTVAPILNRSA